MGIENLLSRLHGVRASGQGRWVAKCPAHADRSPSLSVRECPDGRILLHCFAGCEPGAVIEAVGLEFGELFPEPLTREALPRLRAPFSALEALQCLTTESAIVAFAASDMANGWLVDPDRVAAAAGRIAAALEAVHAA